ncbi:MAG: integrase core domain-containing protein [Candidatus Thermoplasmatota archaeon]|nr:integrase core domain-containing protein [Candidatus Thermoplasmatota archaeon]MCG2724713.1 integrase core domain-containing protein [Elusimicrobiota bacterium]
MLQRTRVWVYKWIKRYKSEDGQWYLNESTEPKRKPNKIDPVLEMNIIKSRKKLVKRDTPETRYAFHGAVAIHQELDNLGYKNKPTLSTINRVLKRNDLITKEQREKGNKESKVYYPEIRARYPGHIHQLDLVTPRYITGYGKIVSVNRIDIYTAQANLNQFESKGADSIISFIVEDWAKYGIPRYLQLDNEASFRGSLYHPKTFGKLARFCLNFGVELIFIPFREPWRNGYIESFNGRFNDQLWLFQKFTDLEHLRNEAKQFRDKYNKFQIYKKEHFSKQYLQGCTKRFFPKGFKFNLSTELPITDGKIHFVRLVNEKGYINVFNEDFYINKNLSFEYIWATIFTKEQELKFYYQANKESKRELIKSVEYKLREAVKDKISVKEFC